MIPGMIDTAMGAGGGGGFKNPDVAAHYQQLYERQQQAQQGMLEGKISRLNQACKEGDMEACDKLRELRDQNGSLFAKMGVGRLPGDEPGMTYKERLEEKRKNRTSQGGGMSGSGDVIRRSGSGGARERRQNRRRILPGTGDVIGPLW